MAQNNYLGFNKVMKDALVENRGKTVLVTKEDKIRELERKLDTQMLTHAEIAEIRKQLKNLNHNNKHS
jgi:hypothetical protein